MDQRWLCTGHSTWAGRKVGAGVGATALLETPPLSCKLAEQEGNCWGAPDPLFAHLCPQLGGLRAGQHAWGDVHPGEGRVPSLGHLVQQLPERLLHVHASHQNGECWGAESSRGLPRAGLCCSMSSCSKAPGLQPHCPAPSLCLPRRLRTTKSPSTSLLTSRATRWKSRRTMCPACGLMVSATAWAACRCPVERKLGCRQTESAAWLVWVAWMVWVSWMFWCDLSPRGWCPAQGAP